MSGSARNPGRGAAGPPTGSLTRRVLMWTAVLPLSLAALLAVLRLGEDRRAEHADGAAIAADSAAAALWRASVATPLAGGAWSMRASAQLAAARPAGYDLTLYRLAEDGVGFLPLGQTATPAPGTGPLDRSRSERLRLLDRSFAVWSESRAVGLAPIKDRDQWDMIGALAARPLAPAPARVPRVPLGGALLAIGATLLISRRVRVDRRSDYALLLLPSLLFLAAMLWLAPAPAAASFRFWSMLATGAAVACALIGSSLAATAQQPLRTREGARAWLFLAPSFAHLLLFSVGPIVFALFLSFHEWNLLDPQRTFVGVGNYAELLRDAPFWRAVRNTAIYVLFVPAGMVVGLALALLLDRGFPGVRVLRAIMFLPYVTSFVAISLVWKWMFEPDVGLLNNFLRTVGLPAQRWLSSPATALPSLMLMSIWMYAGYMMVLFLAGLQSIPGSLYESARMDGAGAWQRFRRITLPLLRPTVFFVLVTMVIFMFQVFTAVYVMTEGGPLHATDVIVYHIYRNAWEYLRMGYASAMAWVLFAMVFIVTLVQFRWLGRSTAQ